MEDTNMRSYALLAALLLAGCTSAQPPAPRPAAGPDYFPLAVGNRWEYSADKVPARRVVEVSGTERIGEKLWYRVRWDTANLLLRVTEQGRLVEWDRDKEQEVLRVDFRSPIGVQYTARAFCASQGAIDRRDQSEVQVHYQATCSDAGVMSETYGASIGLKGWTEESFTGPRSWRLIRARIGGREISF
jgi:hypothetical protein